MKNRVKYSYFVNKYIFVCNCVQQWQDGNDNVIIVFIIKVHRHFSTNFVTDALCISHVNRVRFPL